MAASMTKKDFSLLQDAVNEGIAAFLNDPVVQKGEHKPRSPAMERRLRQRLAEALAERLKYTNDDFNRETFVRGIAEHDAVTRNDPVPVAAPKA